MTEEIINIYYYKGFPKGFGAPKEIKMNDYELVCSRKVDRAPNHSDDIILESHFELFNWVHEGFQPNDPEVGFNRPDSVYHTSMSVGDIVEISGKKYVCDSSGWKEIMTVA
ncbi:hypothetical protein D3C87_574260 [compost metagenome]